MMHLSRLTLFFSTPLLRSGGFLAMYNLMSAAAAAGVNRSTVLRPIKAINVKGVCTNTIPVCAYRGAGRPEAAYLLERLVDAAARELGMSPDAIRRINFVPPSAMP